MADSREVNETEAAAANGDQQVRSNVTQNDTYYKTEQFYELIWSFEYRDDKTLWRMEKMFFTQPGWLFNVS